MSLPRIGKIAWGVMAYNIGVIAFGAFVRATHSGDGCGSHWPLCNGEIVPTAPSVERMIEFTHRVTSGICGIVNFILMILIFRAFAKGHPARKAATGSVFFTFVEALLGAGLVIFGLTDTNDSIARAIVMGLHLANTFVLLGFLTWTAYLASGREPFKWRAQGPIGAAIWIGIAGLMLLGVSGAVTALGDTLFPSRSLAEGLHADFSPTAHILIRLRLFHPLIATSVSIYLLFLAIVLRQFRPSVDVRRASVLVTGMVFTSMAIGIVNLWMMAPVWMQMVHLVFADALWISLLLMSFSALAATPLEAFDPRPEREAVPAPRLAGRALIKQYVALTKPRIISLLLFTTLTAMFMAAGGWPGGWLFLAVAVGGYMAAGAANAINMIIDRDIDGSMERTATRPTVTHAIPTRHAMTFALVLAGLSFALLTWAANLLTAVLAMAGLLFYVFIYTLLLKRRTWHNIVIGGAAGAFPPLVGWAAVTGDLNVFAWTLFAIIFFWTPVHFWALAILIKDDYAKAGIPMLPVVHGDRVTIIQIGVYAVLTALISLIPLTVSGVGVFYVPAAFILNLVLLARCLVLYRKPERQEARFLFKYSMVYLAALFLVLAIDRSVLL